VPGSYHLSQDTDYIDYGFPHFLEAHAKTLP